MSFSKIVHLKGYLGQIKKKLKFRFCRPILEKFRISLLIALPNLILRSTTSELCLTFLMRYLLSNILFPRNPHRVHCLFQVALGNERPTRNLFNLSCEVQIYRGSLVLVSRVICTTISGVG